MHNVKVASYVLFGAQETAFRLALRKCSKEVGEDLYICNFGEGEVHAIKHIFLQKVSARHEEHTSP